MKKLIRIVLLLALAAGVLGTFYFLWKKSQPKVKTYQIEEVAIATIEKRTVATGKVEPRNEIMIKPQMSGIIAELYKEAGDFVKAGEVIAKIKVIPDMVSLSNAESRVTRAQLVFDQSKRNFDRDEKLYAEKVLSRDNFEKSKLQFKNDEEELKAAKENLSLVRDGISSDKSQLSNTLVRSTINGTILNVPVKIGNSVIQSNTFNDGTTIASVANMSDRLFVGKLDETEVGRMQPGMLMDIMIGALQDVKLQAVLEYISPKGSEEAGAVMFEMKAAVKVPENVFVRAGYSANAEIVMNKAEKVLTIPESCVEFSNDSAFVQILTIESPQTFERKHIEVGMSDGMKIEVKSGLKLKDKVRGAEKMDEKKSQTSKGA